MKKQTHLAYCLLIILPIFCYGDNNTPNFDSVSIGDVGKNRCDLPNELVTSILTKYQNRGNVNGAYDEDQNGIIDVDESFTVWDFHQLIYLIRRSKSNKTKTWTNVDTCYKFSIILLEYYEDKTQKAIWQTCRKFIYSVSDNLGKHVGQKLGKACRNFSTKNWEIY